MTQGELARLIMVMADPLLQSDVSSMFASLSRAQLDRDGPAGQDTFQTDQSSACSMTPISPPKLLMRAADASRKLLTR
jgi:hypothetical protein